MVSVLSLRKGLYKRPSQLTSCSTTSRRLEAAILQVPNYAVHLDHGHHMPLVQLRCAEQAEQECHAMRR